MEEHITDEKQPSTKFNQNLMEPSELTASVKEIEKNMWCYTVGIRLAKSRLWEIRQNKQSDFFINCKEKKRDTESDIEMKRNLRTLSVNCNVRT